MSSVSSVSSSSSSSIYGTRNVLTGLASGLDTETMIENSVSGYKTKIQTLLQKQTKVEWQQDAFRSIIDKLASLSSKYTSYTSSTNLMSKDFFTSNVVTSVTGTNADKVSASGKSSSDVQIKSVDQLASAARYTIDADLLAFNQTSSDAEEAGIEWHKTVDASKIAGEMGITYGSRTFSLTFSENETYTSASDLAKAIESKLSEQSMTLSDGSTVKASDRIGVSISGTTITLTDKANAGNNVYVSSASTGMKNAGIGVGADNGKSFSINVGELYERKTMADFLSGKKIDVTLDGNTKSITIGELDPEKTDENGQAISLQDQLKESLQTSIDKAFGSGHVQVGINANGGVEFTNLREGSILAVTSDVNEQLGMNSAGSTSYFNISKTIGELLGSGYVSSHGTAVMGEGEITQDADTKKWYDSAGNLVDSLGYRLGNDGNRIYGMELIINGENLGTFSSSTSMESIMNAINNNTDVGVNVSYSKLTNQFVFTARETGSGGTIEFDSELGQRLFTNTVQGTNEEGYTDMVDAGKFTAGTDAEFTAIINGQEISMSRSTNTVDLDGLKVTLKAAFDAPTRTVNNADGVAETEADPSQYVSFSSTANSDTIVDAIKSFVEDYNAVVKEIHDTYTTQPAEKNTSTHTKYEPLTEEEKADMSDSEIATYEEKAKQGVLFGDSDLSQLYSRLLSAISPGGNDRKAMEAMGLETEYADGLTTLTLDEDKLRAALESDPDGVRNVFTKTMEYDGASSDGLMTTLKKTLDAYASTSYATPGILVSKAGTTLSSNSLLSNTLQSKIDDYQDQIDNWYTKMDDKIDYYTQQFSKLEQLIAEMNSQSSVLSGLTGSSY